MSRSCCSYSLLIALLLLGAALSPGHCRRPRYSEERGERRWRAAEEEEEREREEEEEEEGEGKTLDLELGEGYELLRTEGGAMRVWSQNVEAIRNMAVGVAELELEEQGLLLPTYADSPKVAYVLQGRGYMGAVLPPRFGDSVTRQPYIRQVKKGDVVALPQGTVYWWYNDGEEIFRMFCAADSSFGVKPGHIRQFALAGAQRRHFGSLLHGFSHDALAAAWGVDTETIKSLLDNQREVSIIRVQQSIRFPQPHEQEERRSRRRERWSETYDEDNKQFTYRHGDAGSIECFHELQYSTSPNKPDFFVEGGGFLNLVDFQKLPVLHHVGFGVARVSLAENAMFAPSFISNAHQLIYITQGNGRIEVSSGDGQKVFDKEVSEGSVIVIPQFFPAIKIAGNDGLQWVNIITSARPSMSFLAGRNSVYRGIPKQVLSAAFNVDEETLDELGRDEAVIFPPRRRERFNNEHKGHEAE